MHRGVKMPKVVISNCSDGLVVHQQERVRSSEITWSALHHH
jgi:hypothetical protein